ncbi:MAG: hypothetical protein ACRDKZ_13145 [Actinomycetota bacterium]
MALGLLGGALIAWLLEADALAVLIVFCTLLGTMIGRLLGIAGQAATNWSKALYGNDPERKNHWSRRR